MPLDEPNDEYAEERRVAHSALRAQARDVDVTNAHIYVLADKRGRQLVWDILSQCGVFNASFDRDPGVMAMKEGRRDVGIWLLAQLEGQYPGAYAQMRQEHTEREWRYAAIPEPEVNDHE